MSEHLNLFIFPNNLDYLSVAFEHAQIRSRCRNRFTWLWRITRIRCSNKSDGSKGSAEQRTRCSDLIAQITPKDPKDQMFMFR